MSPNQQTKILEILINGLKQIQDTGRNTDPRTMIEKIQNLIKMNPDLLTDKVLDALTEVAMNSPHRNITPDQFIQRNDATMQFYICKAAMNVLVNAANIYAPARAEAIISRVEKAVSESLDFEVRREAVMCLWTMDGNEKTRSYAVAALERQSKDNSNLHIRGSVREQLISMSNEFPDVIPTVVSALSHGAEETHEQSRARAIALLTTFVRQPATPESDMQNIKSIFEKAVARIAPGEDSHAWAAKGLVWLTERAEQGPNFWRDKPDHLKTKI